MATQPHSQQPQQSQGPNPRVPLLASVSQRGTTFDTDGQIINGYAEKLQTGEVWAVKRPGWASYAMVGAGGGGGIFYWNGDIYYITGTTTWTLNKSGSPVTTLDATGGAYSFSSAQGATPRLFLHNSTHAYYYSVADGLVSIAALNALAIMKAGAAYLDATMYVLGGPGTAITLYGSGINDLTTFTTGTNFIQAQMMGDPGVAVFRQLNYVIVVKQFTTEGFYDAGNPTGSPLASAQGVFLPYGCVSASTIQQIEEIALWMGTSTSGGAFVVALENLRPRIVSTPAVERLLQSADITKIYSWAFRLYGHRFYGITFPNNNFTLVYDINTDEWFRWMTGAGAYIPFTGMSTLGNQLVLAQHENGDIFKVSGDFYLDAGVSFALEVYTPSWDGGTEAKKYHHRLDLLCDQNGVGRIQVRCSDDDYLSWSNFRLIDASKTKKALYNCGTFRKRAWHIRYEANGPMRLKAIELDLMLGAG